MYYKLLFFDEFLGRKETISIEYNLRNKSIDMGAELRKVNYTDILNKMTSTIQFLGNLMCKAVFLFI